MSAPRQSTNSPEERIAELERRLAEREDNLEFIRAAVTHLLLARFMGDPIDEFFAHPEDWEVVIPVPEPPNLPERPCLVVCNENYQDRLAECRTRPTLEERVACRRQVSTIYNRCVDNCNARS
jgi:hypothetical protein